MDCYGRVALEDLYTPKPEDTSFYVTFTFPTGGIWYAMILLQPNNYNMQWSEHRQLRQVLDGAWFSSCCEVPCICTAGFESCIQLQHACCVELYICDMIPLFG